MESFVLSDEEFGRLGKFDLVTEEYYILTLGIGLQYEYSQAGVKFSAPYMEMGKRLWRAFKVELYEIICDSEEQKPKEWLNDLITGDIRNLITGIVSAITAKYDVTLGIALPVAALIVKSGVINYCSERPKRRPKENVRLLLEEKKQQFKKGDKVEAKAVNVRKRQHPKKRNGE